MRRIRQLGMFQGFELEAEEPEPGAPELPEIFQNFRSSLRSSHDPTFDPLSDPLDEPFPEELE